VSSNIAQSYPYSSETESERAQAVDKALNQFDGLRDKVSAEADPMPDEGPAEPGRPHRSWIFVCPKHVEGRLHIAGYAKERHALFTVCDVGGETYLR
jgi:hypothetical protein